MENGTFGSVETGKAELEDTELTINKSTSALLAGIAGLMVMSTPSLATPVGGAQHALAVMTFSDGALVVPVAKKKRRRIRRSRRRGRGFNHFRNGFYYSQPFWNYGDFYEDDYDFYDDDDDDEPDYARGGDRHEDWCRRKYRSYKVRTDTWTDFDSVSPKGRLMEPAFLSRGELQLDAAIAGFGIFRCARVYGLELAKAGSHQMLRWNSRFCKLFHHGNRTR